MKRIGRYKVSIIFGIVVIFLYYLNLINTTVLLATLGSIATIYYGSLKTQLDNDLLFKELFNSFNDRYDNQINSLRLEPRDLLDDEKILVIDYFNLCAEEYLWMIKGRIPKDVWNAWKAGIMNNLEVPQVCELFMAETRTYTGKASYYGLYDEVMN
jgi:hypothetical protein